MSKPPREEWYLSDNEDYYPEGPFASKSVAIERGRSIYQSGFFVGIREEDFEPKVDASLVVDDIGEQAYEEVGDFASEGWPETTLEQDHELGRRLTEVLRRWLKEVDARALFTIRKVEYVKHPPEA